MASHPCKAIQDKDITHQVNKCMEEVNLVHRVVTRWVLGTTANRVSNNSRNMEVVELTKMVVRGNLALKVTHDTVNLKTTHTCTSSNRFSKITCSPTIAVQEVHMNKARAALEWSSSNRNPPRNYRWEISVSCLLISNNSVPWHPIKWCSRRRADAVSHHITWVHAQFLRDRPTHDQWGSSNHLMVVISDNSSSLSSSSSSSSRYSWMAERSANQTDVNSNNLSLLLNNSKRTVGIEMIGLLQRQLTK